MKFWDFWPLAAWWYIGDEGLLGPGSTPSPCKVIQFKFVVTNYKTSNFKSNLIDKVFLCVRNQKKVTLNSCPSGRNTRKELLACETPAAVKGLKPIALDGRCS